MGIVGMNIGVLRVVLNMPGRVPIPLEAGVLSRDGVVIIGGLDPAAAGELKILPVTAGAARVLLANPEDILCKLARANKAVDVAGRAAAPKNVVLPF